MSASRAWLFVAAGLLGALSWAEASRSERYSELFPERETGGVRAMTAVRVVAPASRLDVEEALAGEVALVINKLGFESRIKDRKVLSYKGADGLNYFETCYVFVDGESAEVVHKSLENHFAGSGSEPSKRIPVILDEACGEDPVDRKAESGQDFGKSR